MWPLDASLPCSGNLGNFTHVLNTVPSQGCVKWVSNCGYLFLKNCLIIVKLVGMFLYNSPLNHSTLALPTICSFNFEFQSWVSILKNWISSFPQHTHFPASPCKVRLSPFQRQPSLKQKASEQSQLSVLMYTFSLSMKSIAQTELVAQWGLLNSTSLLFLKIFPMAGLRCRKYISMHSSSISVIPLNPQKNLALSFNTPQPMIQTYPN